MLITIVGKQKGAVNLAGANRVVDRTHHLGDAGPEEARLTSSLAGRQDGGGLADEDFVLYKLVRQRIQEMDVPYTIIHIKPDVPRPGRFHTPIWEYGIHCSGIKGLQVEWSLLFFRCLWASS